jgi:LPXTG-motif cell wall-anchored protein
MRKVMMVLGVLVMVGALGALAQPAGAESTGAYTGASTSVAATDPQPTVAAADLVATDPQVQAATVSQGALPVTGSDVVGLVGLAAVLIAAGAGMLVVRRRADQTPGLVSAG